MSDILFECKDQWFPEYNLKVIRKDDRTGTLTVTHNEQKLYEQEVNLSYGAQFGPDVFDLGAWSYIACQVVDKHLQERGITPKPPEE